ncbi:MAG: hydrogenase expression protein [Thermomicrobiales bacterium]|nr:hydrogenase expression protein [Thermomicrobiales bacterium]
MDTTQRLGIGKLPAALLARLLASSVANDANVLIGPGVGRDAAAIALGDRVLVAKTDPITFATHDAAAYLIDVNANDLACLGAEPRWLLVTTLFPEGVSTDDVEAHFRAIAAVCDERGIALVGGHTEITTAVRRTVLVGQMLGESTPERLLRPGGARPGDRLLLAGAVAIEGTALLARELPAVLAPLIGSEMLREAAGLIEHPGLSVVPAARALLATGDVVALHDPTEGGLSTGVRELATAAGCGARLVRANVAVLPQTRAIAGALELDPLGMLASGALLAAAPPAAVSRLRAAASTAGITLTEIGEVRPAAEGFVLMEDGVEAPLPEWPTDEVGRALAEHAASEREFLGTCDR